MELLINEIESVKKHTMRSENRNYSFSLKVIQNETFPRLTFPFFFQTTTVKTETNEFNEVKFINDISLGKAILYLSTRKEMLDRISVV